MELFDGLIVSTFPVVAGPEVHVERQRKRINLKTAFELRMSFIKSAEHGQKEAVPIDPDLKQARRAEPSAQLCDPTLRPAPDKPHPFRPPPVVSEFRSDRVLCRRRGSSVHLKLLISTRS